MNQALAWVNNVMRALGKWVPRLRLVHPTHRAVVFGPRGGAREKGPGLVWYWPITHEMVKVPIAMRSMMLGGQILAEHNPTTRSLLPYNCMVMVALQYRITDAVASATRTLSAHALVDNRARAAISAAWPGSMEAAKSGEWINAALLLTRNSLNQYGIYAERIDIAEMGLTVCSKSLSNWMPEEDPMGRQPEEGQQ